MSHPSATFSPIMPTEFSRTEAPEVDERLEVGPDLVEAALAGDETKGALPLAMLA